MLTAAGLDGLDAMAWATVLFGALLAGFTTGFAGFGTGLVASGLWFHALPAGMVPPLVVLASVGAQIASMFTVRRAFAWRRTMPYLAGGIVGVPIGVLALKMTSPDALRLFAGLFLMGYAMFQLLGGTRLSLGNWGGKPADGVVGAGGGFLGGFAGLSGPLPIVWLQLRGGPSEQQRATYQPFNLVVLVLAGVGMVLSGQIDRATLMIVGLCFPLTLLGAAIGARVYNAVSETAFKRAVLVLLLTSGVILCIQSALR